MTLNGSHHRTLSDNALSNRGSCAYVSGDLGRINRNGNGWSGLGEVGVCHAFENRGVMAGVGVGHSEAGVDQDLGSHTRVKGEFLVAEVDWRPADSSLLASALLMTGQWRADLRRSYSAGTAWSDGDTKLTTTAIRARLDWQDAFRAGKVSFTPHIQYTVSRNEMDAYQETGGTAPAFFNATAHTARESRLGLTGAYAISERTTLLGRLEWAHRFDAEDAGVTGSTTILGVANTSFAVQGAQIRQNWERVGADVVHKFDARNRLAFSGNVSSNGQDVDVSIGFNWVSLF